MKRLALIAAPLALLAVAACNDSTDNVVQAPAPGAAPESVSATTAATATTSAAVALGMTRAQLEDADLLGPEPAYAKLGEVETLVLDAAGQVSHLVVDLENTDRDVVVPIGDVTSVRRGDDVDLTTALTAEQLRALPEWNPNAPVQHTAPARP